MDEKKVLSDIESKLVTDNIDYAYKSALAYRGKGAEYDDLVQEASEAMCYAAKRFNPTCGTKFTTFATKYINGRLAQFIMKYGWPSYLNGEQRIFVRILSLDRLIECDGELVSAKEVLPSDWDKRYENCDKVLERLDNALRCLTVTERELLEARYAFSGDKDSLRKLWKQKYNNLGLSQMYHKCDMVIDKIVESQKIN